MDFEKALRKGYRYPSAKGELTTEDLWALKPKALDDVYKALMEKRRETTTESLISPKDSAAARQLDEQIEIVKHIYAVKQDEAAKAKLAVENKAKKERIMAIIADRDDKKLADMSDEELSNLMKSFDAPSEE